MKREIETGDFEVGTGLGFSYGPNGLLFYFFGLRERWGA